MKIKNKSFWLFLATVIFVGVAICMQKTNEGFQDDMLTPVGIVMTGVIAQSKNDIFKPVVLGPISTSKNDLLYRFNIIYDYTGTIIFDSSNIVKSNIISTFTSPNSYLCIMPLNLRIEPTIAQNLQGPVSGVRATNLEAVGVEWQAGANRAAEAARVAALAAAGVASVTVTSATTAAEAAAIRAALVTAAAAGEQAGDAYYASVIPPHIIIGTPISMASVAEIDRAYQSLPLLPGITSAKLAFFNSSGVYVDSTNTPLSPNLPEATNPSPANSGTATYVGVVVECKLSDIFSFMENQRIGHIFDIVDLETDNTVWSNTNPVDLSTFTTVKKYTITYILKNTILPNTSDIKSIIEYTGLSSISNENINLISAGFEN